MNLEKDANKDAVSEVMVGAITHGAGRKILCGNRELVVGVLVNGQKHANTQDERHGWVITQ